MNKKILFKNLTLLLGGIALLASCDDDDKDDKSVKGFSIQANVENGNDYNSTIDAVRGLINADEEHDEETDSFYWTGHEVVNTDYKNGSFTLNLPQIEDQYLYPLEGIPDGIKVSNVDVKGAGLLILAYKSGNAVGEFEYEKRSSINNYLAGYIYVNGDASMIGSETEEYPSWTYNYDYDVSLTKGWNIIYFKYSESLTDKTSTEEVTSNSPSGLKWYFNSYGYEYSIENNQAQSLRSSQSVAKRKPLSLFKQLK
jgi:hypothetical protein